MLEKQCAGSIHMTMILISRLGTAHGGRGDQVRGINEFLKSHVHSDIIFWRVYPYWNDISLVTVWESSLIIEGGVGLKIFEM